MDRKVDWGVRPKQRSGWKWGKKGEQNTNFLSNFFKKLNLYLNIRLQLREMRRCPASPLTWSQRLHRLKVQLVFLLGSSFGFVSHTALRSLMLTHLQVAVCHLSLSPAKGTSSTRTWTPLRERRWRGSWQESADPAHTCCLDLRALERPSPW